MPLRILRMLATALLIKRLQNACAAKPLLMFRCVTFIRQAIMTSQD